jgi:hypothetical protein
MKKTHTGSCHCGAVQFEVDTDLEKTMDCNCSHCAKKGAIWNFVDNADFRITKGEDELSTYQFNKKHIDHQFCKHCGTQPFGQSSTYGKAGINVRCLDDVDISTLTPEQLDGKSL